MKNKRYKAIQESKRAWLNVFLNAYEHRIQRYDQQFQHEFRQLESKISKSTPTTTVTQDPTTLIKKIEDYMKDHTTKLKEKIYREMSTVRQKLLQDRQHASSSKNTIGVSPEPYLDLISNPFDKHQWEHLCLGKIAVLNVEMYRDSSTPLGPSSIRPNQSATRSRKQQEVEVAVLHKEILMKVRDHLFENQRMPMTSPILKRYSDHLLQYLNQCYLTPLSYRDHIQAQEQASNAASIREVLKKSKLILRMTDKGGNFYIGSAKDFDEKAKKYFGDTNAFVELSENPFKEILDNVCQLLNRLSSKKLIESRQYTKMMPDLKKAELSHLYFNPKTHKVEWNSGFE